MLDEQGLQCNMFYERNGRIGYLDGDSMYGFRTPKWKEIKEMKEGAVTRTIQDDTLPGGPREKVITYHAPFDCPNREADYTEAWAFFEKVAS